MSSSCVPFQQIYGSGEALCNRIFGDALVYTKSPTTTAASQSPVLAYTMWFFSAVNPNDQTSALRRANNMTDANYSSSATCGPQMMPAWTLPSTMGECLPFKNRACCSSSQMNSVSLINNLYGSAFEWSRCGALSEQCERFFVQAQCFMNCDPNAQIFRQIPPTYNASNPLSSSWQINRMPIDGDYCDAWYSACWFWVALPPFSCFPLYVHRCIA